MSGWDSDISEPSRFLQAFICIPFDRYKHPELETGNKIVMPPSSLAYLTYLRIGFPYFFKMESFDSDKVSHCGVLEFGAEEGIVYMPRWMMANLGIGDGDEVILREAWPPRASWMLLRPHEAAFLVVSDVRAVMETGLRGFSCLTKGDTIVMRYGERDFRVDVVDVGPAGGGGVVSLLDTDCAVEFAPPLDHVEEAAPPSPEVVEEEQEKKGFRPFTGRAARLDGEAGEENGGKIGAAAAAGEKNGGKIGEEVELGVLVREFRAFSGLGRRLDGAAVSVPVEAAAQAPAPAKKKKEKDEGKEEKFKAFSGKGRVLGGPFFDN